MYSYFKYNVFFNIFVSQIHLPATNTLEISKAFRVKTSVKWAHDFSTHKHTVSTFQCCCGRMKSRLIQKEHKLTRPIRVLIRADVVDKPMSDQWSVTGDRWKVPSHYSGWTRRHVNVVVSYTTAPRFIACLVSLWRRIFATNLWFTPFVFIQIMSCNSQFSRRFSLQSLLYL